MIEDISSPRKTFVESWNGTGTPPGGSYMSSHADGSRFDRALIVYQNADDTANEPVVTQLYAKARLVLPAVMNYLYFSSAQVAVVYFGKRLRKDGVKVGIAEGAEDFKIKMIRFLTVEIWPPLLRTDAPDESLGGDLLTPSRNGVVAPEDTPNEEAQYLREMALERSWFRKSIENHMQVLLYLKRGEGGTKYLKVLLSNTAQRLHFDVTDQREEKYRWEMRMLYTRIMDNLETQKAIDSYESYERWFREACTVAARYAVELERPLQPMLPVTVWGGEEDSTVPTPPLPPPILRRFSRGSTPSPPCQVEIEQDLRSVSDDGELSTAAVTEPTTGGRLGEVRRFLGVTSLQMLARPSSEPPSGRGNNGSGLTLAPPSSSLTAMDAFTPVSRGATRAFSHERYYRWMDSLNKPESATLDYKSYFSYTAEEIKHRCVKFMCGFLNAYREGKLVIGVYEISRRDADGNLLTEKDMKNNIVQHNDLVDQCVVGVRITRDQLEDVQEAVSEQLLCCVPPIPPQTVHIDVVPVRFPPNFTYSSRVMVLFEDNNNNSPFIRDALKQKSNYAVRFLYPRGLTIVPLDFTDDDLRELVELVDGEPRDRPFVVAEAYAIAAFTSPQCLTATDWEDDLTRAMSGPRTRCHHVFVDYPAVTQRPLVIPPLHVVEVSVDIKRCNFRPLMNYRGKFFNGWPSIPIWDTTTQSVRRVERNYNLMKPRLAPIGTGPAGAGSSAVIEGQGNIEGTMSLRSPTQDSSSMMPTTTTGPSVVRMLSSPSGPTQLNHTFQRGMVLNGWAWYGNAQIVNNVLEYMYNPVCVGDLLAFRLIHPVWNSVFENRQGIYLIKMIHSTPIGVPQLNMSHEHVSRTQYAFLQSGVPPLPLLMCRVYEILGNPPSPYPFVGVPLIQQSFRIASFLVPLFYRQHYFDGQLRHAVALDLRDGVLKTVELRDGNLLLDAVVGMGFELMSKRQVAKQMVLQRSMEQQLLELRSRSASFTAFNTPPSPRHIDPKRNFLARRVVGLRSYGNVSRSILSSTLPSPLLSDSVRATPREVEPEIPLLHFRFLTKSQMKQTPLFDDVVLREAESSGRRTALLGHTWTLQHLLSWYNALLTDAEHYRFFGYCDRSIAFHVAGLEEICREDLETPALELVMSNQQGAFRLASSHAECALHRKMLEWMYV